MPSLTTDQIQLVRQTVDHALDEAAKVTLPKFRQPIEIDNKAEKGFDPVTIADQEAEQVLRNALMAALPSAAFLGEENSVAIEPCDQRSHLGICPTIQSGLTWVVDPIDGTRAFITGMPLWGTLVALNDGDAVLLGAFDQPWIGERFVGYGDQAERVYQGSTTLLRTRAARPIGECIVQTTTPDMFDDSQSLESFDRVRQQVSMTRYGGDCYAYALLAMGGIDAVVESSLQPYDIQALIPIVEGAGGVITNWIGEPCLSGGNVIAAANAFVHDTLLETLNR